MVRDGASRCLRARPSTRLKRHGGTLGPDGTSARTEPVMPTIPSPPPASSTSTPPPAQATTNPAGAEVRASPGAVSGQLAGAAEPSSSAEPRPAPAPTAIDARTLDEALFGVTRVLTHAGEKSLTSASGFFFERDGRLFLVTSRHVLFDAPSEHAPDRIEIEVHTDARDLTRMSTVSILLHRDGLSVWRDAHDSGGEVDVATIELERAQMPPGSVLRPFGVAHLTADFDRFAVGDRLAIPGFPLGFFDTVHHLPVVRQASIASSFGIRFQGQGFFLTDARMHRGSSGSPVLALREGTERPCRILLGVHSSRMDMATRDQELDESLGLNCAWYADILMALTEA